MSPSVERSSVVVCVVHYDTPDHLERLLESFSQNPPGVPYRIVVADNSAFLRSARDLVERFPNTVYLPMESNLGFSTGCNRAAAEGDEPYLFFLNPDTRIEPGTLETLAGFLEEHPEVGIVGCRNLGEDGEIQHSCRRFPTYRTALANRYSFLTRLFPNNPLSSQYLMKSQDQSKPSAVDWVSGAALMARRSDFDSLGGFDEEYFMYSEDVDLCYRMASEGRAVYYHPLASVYHHIGASSRRNRFRVLIERHRSMYLFYRKHYSLGIPLMDTLTFFGIALRGACFLLLEGLGRTPHR